MKQFFWSCNRSAATQSAVHIGCQGDLVPGSAKVTGCKSAAEAKAEAQVDKMQHDGNCDVMQGHGCGRDVDASQCQAMASLQAIAMLQCNLLIEATSSVTTSLSWLHSTSMVEHSLHCCHTCRPEPLLA